MCFVNIFNFIGPLIGAFIGVLGGFFTQLRIMQKRLKIAKEEEKNRKKYILEILAKEIEHNISLLERFHDEYVKESKEFFDYNLSTTTQEAIWSELIKLEGDAQFVNKLAKIYYDYKHINRKLDFQLNTTSESGLIINLIRRDVLGSIRDLKVSATEESANILKEISEKLNSLS